MMKSVSIIVLFACFRCFDGGIVPSIAYPPLRICAFNIQVFGLSKMDKPEVVSTLIKVFMNYDIILVQEIRDSSETAFDLIKGNLNDEVTARNSKNNEDNELFDSVISVRLGRSDSKEQYGFLYRKNLLSLTDIFQFPEELDLFERPPFVVRFASPTTDVGDFGIIAIHTKPTQAAEEIGNITLVYNVVSEYWNLKDILVAGDLNSDCTYLPDRDHDDVKLYTDVRFKWLIGDDVDTTTGNSECSYDRFVAAGEKLQSAVVPDSAKVVRFDKMYGLTQEQIFLVYALDVSDHYPIEVLLAGKANMNVQSKVRDAKSVETESTVPVSSVYRIRDLYKIEIKDQFIPDYTVTILKEGTRQSLINAEVIRSTFNKAIAEIAYFQEVFPELVTSEMEAVILTLMNSDSFKNDYVYGLKNTATPLYKMKISCNVDSLLCTLRVEKDFE